MSPSGYFVTLATRPLTTNFQQTPVVSQASRAGGSTKEIEYYARITWDDNSIGGLAKQAGFDEIYYADIQTLSIWGGAFKQVKVRVYGHRKDSATPTPPPAHDEP